MSETPDQQSDPGSSAASTRSSATDGWQTKRQDDEETHIRFRRDRGLFCIDVRLHSWRQLFDSRDPSPFRDRDLDDDAVDYIVSSFLEITKSDQSKIVLHLAEGREASVSPEVFAESIHAYFVNERRLRRGKLRQMLRRARMALAIGAVFLTVCMTSSHWIAIHNLGEPGALIREGLVIIGWVAMWRPIDMLLYDWWPLIDMLKAYKKLSRIPVEVLYNQ